jgi:uncharacterized cofD-like protein
MKRYQSWRWLLPGMRVKRYALIASLGILLLILGTLQLTLEAPIARRLIHDLSVIALAHLPPWLSGLIWMLFGLGLFIWGLRSMNRSMLSALTDPDTVVAQVYLRRRLEAGPRIVALGGGTGLSRVLKGLREETANLTAIVAVTDDGGSTGRLRHSFGIPAVGDLVDCLAALSEAPGFPDLMSYRFQRGGELAGHTFGNLMLVSLYELHGNFAEALRQANQMLRLRGAVWPATAEPAHLWGLRSDGTRVEGETAMRQAPGYLRQVGLIEGQEAVMPEVLQAVAQAQLIVLGPGSLFSSVIPSFLPTALRRALQRSPAQLCYIVNLMTEPGETEGLDAYGHYKAIVTHLGRRPEAIVVNTQSIPPAVLQRYAQAGQLPVPFDPRPFLADGVKVIQGEFLEEGTYAQHDPEKLVRALMRLIQSPLERASTLLKQG